MDACESPTMPSSLGTVAASGKGQAKTLRVPNLDRASSLPKPTSVDSLCNSSSARKKETFPRSRPDNVSKSRKLPLSYCAMGSPKPRLVMYYRELCL